MEQKYHKLWILLREKLTKQENGTRSICDQETCHSILTQMAELEAVEFLED